MTINAQRILGTFDIKPTRAPAGAKPDELMIDLRTLPAGSRASLYLPAVRGDDIRTAAIAIQGYQPFTPLDAHTIGCTAQGIVYMPIPRASGNLAGLIDVELPATVRVGDRLTVAVTQLTNQGAELPPSPRRGGSDIARPARTITWRKAAGTFQLALKVKGVRESRPIVENNFSILRWIFEVVPSDSRWHPVFVRYLGALATQVVGLGGNPADIPPSPAGFQPLRSGSTRSGCGALGADGVSGVVGKIDGLVFDHFGDFEGFILETESEARFHFFSREKNVRDIAERAWVERLRVTVISEERDDRRPRRIVLHPTPTER